MPANTLNEFTLSTLSDTQLRRVAAELGLSFELMRDLRFIERFSVRGHGLRFALPVRLAPRLASTGELIERQQEGIQCR